MFRSRNKSRRRDRLKSTHSRRLGVELMEGRMMLSATGLDVPQPVLDLTQYSFWPAKISLTSSYVALATPPTDGGYINSDAVTFTDNSDGQHETSVAGTIAWHLNLAGQATGVAPILLGFNSFNLFDQAIASNAYDPTTVSLLDGRRLDVAIFVPWADSDSPVANMQPVVVGPSPTMPGVSEGGAIPIHAIFADFRKDSHLASGVKVVSSPSPETSVESLASARRLATPDGAISGEWARAMVFEIAGGEPNASDSQSPTGSDEKLQHSEPLSSIQTLQHNVKLAKTQEAAQSNEGSPVGELGQPQSPQSSVDAAAAVAQLLKNALTPGAPAAAFAGEFSLNQSSVAKSPDITAFATTAVFDQLGEDNATVIESTVDGKSWLRSIGTSPLLMVLALERITALNSRRATRESRIAAAKKPRRLRS